MTQRVILVAILVGMHDILAEVALWPSDALHGLPNKVWLDDAIRHRNLVILETSSDRMFANVKRY